MASYWANIKIDRPLLMIVIFLGLFSFAPVYSASIGLAFQYASFDTFTSLFKHAVLVGLGFVILWGAQSLPFRYYGPLSKVLLPLSILLLMITLGRGTTIGDANASRWITIPGIGVSFQPSAFAAVALMIYLARYLFKSEGNYGNFKSTLFKGILPIVLVCGLVLPANFSTAALIFLSSMTLLFIGGYPIRYLLNILGLGVAGLSIFILTVLAFPNISNRVDTWKSRIENFSTGDPESNYQVERAKMAIAEGGLIGRGPGKSTQKHFLPQSTSDFIYAVIVEEYGLIGGMMILLAYVWMLFRIIKIARKAPNHFGRLLAIGLGSVIIFQAFVNLSVAVNLIPVTGQPLPLVSAGGSSTWMVCLALGVILSVSRDEMTESPEQEVNTEAPTEDTAYA